MTRRSCLCALAAVALSAWPLEAKTRRSAAARLAFMRQTGYPHGRPGYVIDHIIPLACGGKDAPENMQWQSVSAVSYTHLTLPTNREV